MLSPRCNVTDRPRDAEWLFVFNQMNWSQMRMGLADAVRSFTLKSNTILLAVGRAEPTTCCVAERQTGRDVHTQVGRYHNQKSGTWSSRQECGGSGTVTRWEPVHLGACGSSCDLSFCSRLALQVLNLTNWQTDVDFGSGCKAEMCAHNMWLFV